MFPWDDLSRRIAGVERQDDELRTSRHCPSTREGTSRIPRNFR